MFSDLLLPFRNYHVFYYLLAGASEEERSTFHLKKPEEYHYLNQVRDPVGLQHCSQV
jgi:myosin heavy subunit